MKYYLIYNMSLQLFGFIMMLIYAIKFVPQITKGMTNKKSIRAILFGVVIGFSIFLFDVSWSLYLICTK